MLDHRLRGLPSVSIYFNSTLRREGLTVQRDPDTGLCKADQAKYNRLKRNPAVEAAEALGDTAMIRSCLFRIHGSKKHSSIMEEGQKMGSKEEQMSQRRFIVPGHCYMKQKYRRVIKLFGGRWHHGTAKARESCCGSILPSAVDLSRALDQPVLYNVTLFAWASVGEDPYMLHLSGTCKGNACLIIIPHASTYAYLAHPARAPLGYNAPGLSIICTCMRRR